jgi:hypothetical protein
MVPNSAKVVIFILVLRSENTPYKKPPSVGPTATT